MNFISCRGKDRSKTFCVQDWLKDTFRSNRKKTQDKGAIRITLLNTAFLGLKEQKWFALKTCFSSFYLLTA